VVGRRSSGVLRYDQNDGKNKQKKKQIPTLRSTSANKERWPGTPDCGMTNQQIGQQLEQATAGPSTRRYATPSLRMTNKDKYRVLRCAQDDGKNGQRRRLLPQTIAHSCAKDAHEWGTRKTVDRDQGTANGGQKQIPPLRYGMTDQKTE